MRKVDVSCAETAPEKETPARPSALPGSPPKRLGVTLEVLKNRGCFMEL